MSVVTHSPESRRPPDTRPLFKSDRGFQMAQQHYQRLLDEITVPCASAWVDSTLGPTHCLCAGDPAVPPAVLLHGLGASAPTLYNQINGLAPHFRVIAVDVPRSMGRSAPTPVPRAGTAAGQWLESVLDGLGIATAHLAGISNGAWLIVRLAGAAPDRIRSAVLMSAAGIVRVSPRLMLRAVPLLLAAWRPPCDQALAFHHMMGVPGTPGIWQDLEMFELLLVHFRREPAPSPLRRAELACLTAPTALLIGQHEAAYPAPGVIRRARAALPNLQQAEVIPRVGHGMVTEDPDGVNARIIRFFQQWDRA